MDLFLSLASELCRPDRVIVYLNASTFRFLKGSLIASVLYFQRFKLWILSAVRPKEFSSKMSLEKSKCLYFINNVFLNLFA